MRLLPSPRRTRPIPNSISAPVLGVVVDTPATPLARLVVLVLTPATLPLGELVLVGVVVVSLTDVVVGEELLVEELLDEELLEDEVRQGELLDDELLGEEL